MIHLTVRPDQRLGAGAGRGAGPAAGLQAPHDADVARAADSPGDLHCCVGTESAFFLG